MKKSIILTAIIIVALLAALSAVFVVRVNHEPYEPVEHDPGNRFIYFTAIDGDHPIEVEMEAGEQEISVAMDNGELRITLTGEDRPQRRKNTKK